MQMVDLNGTWQFKAERLPRVARKHMISPGSWLEASVPGTVHTDLMEAGKIPDPFYRTNETEVQWVDGVSWRYRRRFDVPDPLLDSDHILLVANGLDTFAQVLLNGEPVGEAENMFVAQEFDVRKFLRSGRNMLEIVFDSPVERAKALESEYGRLQVALEPHRVYARKAQYSFGWDWGPRLTTSGIWRPIGIEAFSVGRLFDPFVRIRSLDGRKAEIQVTVRVERYGDDALSVRARIGGNGVALEQTVRVEGGSASVDLTLEDPRLWWPNGLGEQTMYTAEVTLLRSAEELQTLRVPFAVRTVRLVQEADPEGRSFLIEINGAPVFCRGADWIPADTFLPRVTDNVYRRLLTLARDASMNMLRVWGGGVYEKEIFYELCDRLGLMVWQDFMYACGEYPDHPAFLEAARSEAQHVVRRLRNHPSIVLWCGNNECEWGYCTANPEKHADTMRGARIFRDVLPEVVQADDGTRPYWRSSPFGEGFPNSETHGNHHQWGVWSAWKDFREYESNRARFVSEFGFQAPADPLTLERVTVAGDRLPQSPVMDFHNKQVEGPERLFRFQAGHYRVASEWGSFIHTAQLVQAEALKCGVEHWRRRKFSTAGALIWQLNDCWPVSSWSLVDSDLRPKAAYYYARRFFAPLLVSFARAAEGVDVWVTNDFLHEVRGRLEVTLLSFTGKSLWQSRSRVDVRPNSSFRAAGMPPAALGKADPLASYLLAELFDGRRKVAENRLFFREAKDLALPKAKIRLSVHEEEGGLFRATMRSKVLALGARVCADRSDVDFHDNVFDLDPGRPRSTRLTTNLSSGKLKRSLSVFAING